MRFPESWSSTSLANKAVLAHRPRYFCLDNAFALIEGHPARRLPPLLSRSLGYSEFRRAAQLLACPEQMSNANLSNGPRKRLKFEQIHHPASVIA